MSRALEESRTQLLRKAAELAERQGGDDLTAFLSRYYKHVATEDLLARQPEDLLGAAAQPPEPGPAAPGRHRQRAGLHPERRRARLGHRPHGHRDRHRRHAVPGRLGHRRAEPRGAARSTSWCTPSWPSAATPPAGWSRSSTSTARPGRRTCRYDAVRRVLDAPRDRPRERLGRPGRADGAAAAGAGRRPGRRRGLAQDAPDRAATRRARWPSSRRPASTRPRSRTPTTCCEWLADGHFTFIGYREYALVEVDGEDALEPVPAPGLGVLRYDPQMSDSFSRLSPSARAKARDPHLLIVTKANSRSTVHRADLPRLRRGQELRRRAAT